MQKRAFSGERMTAVGAAADVSSGDVSRAARRLPAPAHRRINGAVFSLSLSLSSSSKAPATRWCESRWMLRDREKKLRRAASRCHRPSVGSPRGRGSRVPRLISVRRSMGPVALGVAPRRWIAEDSRHRHGILSPPSAENSAIDGWIRVNKIFLGQGSLYCFSFFILSFSLCLSPLLLRANVTKSAVANALCSGLPLENREEELLPRGESIPRSLWWSKGDCRRRAERRKRQGGMPRRERVDGAGI